MTDQETIADAVPCVIRCDSIKDSERGVERAYPSAPSVGDDVIWADREAHFCEKVPCKPGAMLCARVTRREFHASDVRLYVDLVAEWPRK